MHRTRGLLRARQSVDVAHDLGIVVVEVEVQLAATPQLQHEQEETPPCQEAPVVGDGILVAAIGQIIQPVIEVREEVRDRLPKRLADN